MSRALMVYVAQTVIPRADDPIPPDVPPANLATRTIEGK
jgi:hypothetical protein